MEKILEKKNLGIPVTLLVLIAYFIGYYITGNLYGLLVAVIFGGLVFALDFDDRVKTAVKQSYTIALLLSLFYLLLEILNQFKDIVTTNDYEDPFILQTVFTNLYRYVSDVFNIIVIVIFAILVIVTLAKKDVKLNFILSILGEGAPKQSGPVYQQQVPPVVAQSVQGIACTKCGAGNKAGAGFCGSCGNKL